MKAIPPHPSFHAITQNSLSFYPASVWRSIWKIFEAWQKQTWEECCIWYPGSTCLHWVITINEWAKWEGFLAACRVVTFEPPKSFLYHCKGLLNYSSPGRSQYPCLVASHFFIPLFLLTPVLKICVLIYKCLNLQLTLKFFPSSKPWILVWPE